MKVRNTFLIFIVSGFWHGTNWTFIVWGALNAIYFLQLLLLKKNTANTDTVAQGKYLPTIKEVINMGTTLGLPVLAWVFFRAENMGYAWRYLSEIFSYSFSSHHITQELD
jgi:alginate O-acetyltransferase complex protein AlgI